ncbi:hypothetical protein E1B28_008023 [Marasmius oreades]|uniref:MYND-type domain-containing protein n=1 Tax=Marasmius oreades TaxID=181124 RepID=A0A9P7S4N8_9AGAR|nr:uncharacterized protein E1B28_008023 [Marasmius oreades]KAG7094423.1 hypothetical protein E1B28_008023 [Marasmius oreades]
MPLGASESPDHVEDASPGPVFLEEAKKLFPSGPRAISALRRIGQPRSAILQSTNPSREVRTFLQILGSLGMDIPQTTETLIKENWTSFLAPWTFFVLEELVLSDRDPQTPAAWVTYNAALWIIPSFIRLLRSKEIILRTLRDLTPHLSTVFARVWLKTVDQHHLTWGAWSAVVADIYLDDIAAKVSACDMRLTEILYRAGTISLRHIHREIPRVPTMTSQGISDLNAFLAVLNPYGGPGPLFHVERSEATLEALIRLLFALLCKRKKSQDAESSSIGYELTSAKILFEHIDYIMDGNIRVSQALEGGLVVALVKACPYYFSPNESAPADQRFDVQASQFLERIAQFLVFPSVLHQFLRSVKAVTKSEKHENKLQEYSTLMWNVWDRTKRKALYLRAIRSDLKSVGRFWRCNNDLCDGTNTHYGAPFLQCSGCLETFYCSRTCRKIEWRAGHREQCAAIRKLREVGAPNATETDEQFFVGITKRFISTNRHPIDAAIKLYAAAVASSQRAGQTLSKEKLLIAHGLRNPILVIDYVKAKPAQMSDCAMVDSEELLEKFEKRVGPSRMLHIVENFRQKNLTIVTLFVVILLPMKKGEAAGLAYEFVRQH